MTFEGSTNPIDVEKWLSLVEKYFGVIECPKERKVKLAKFLLQGSVKDWWILYAARARGVDFVT